VGLGGDGSRGPLGEVVADTCGGGRAGVAEQPLHGTRGAVDAGGGGLDEVADLDAGQRLGRGELDRALPYDVLPLAEQQVEALVAGRRRHLGGDERGELGAGRGVSESRADRALGGGAGVDEQGAQLAEAGVAQPLQGVGAADGGGAQAAMCRVSSAQMLVSRSRCRAAARPTAERRCRRRCSQPLGAPTSEDSGPPELAPASHAVVGAPVAAEPALTSARAWAAAARVAAWAVPCSASMVRRWVSRLAASSCTSSRSAGQAPRTVRAMTLRDCAPAPRTPRKRANASTCCCGSMPSSGPASGMTKNGTDVRPCSCRRWNRSLRIWARPERSTRLSTTAIEMPRSMASRSRCQGRASPYREPVVTNTHMSAISTSWSASSRLPACTESRSG